MAANGPALPTHVDDTIRAITKLYSDHHSEAGSMQRGVERVTAWIGRPGFIAVLSAVVAFWVGANAAAHWMGVRLWDPPPFNWLQGLASLLALYVAVMILATQRRADQLAERREQLTLQLAILSEQKLAKLIALFEEARKDSPTLPDRVDDEASAMAVAADTDTVLSALKENTNSVPEAAS